MFKTGLLVLTLLVLTVSVAYAQDSPIEFGQTVTGELTASEYEFRYTFNGTADAIVVIEMNPVDTLGDLDNPELALLDASGAVIIDTTESFTFGRSLLAVQLPADGAYTIIATREDGALGDSVGEFTLELIAPTVITAEAAASGEISSEDRDQYYLVSASDVFSLNYSKESGDFNPEIEVNILDASTGGLETVAALNGSAVTVGMLGRFQADTPYIVTVGEALFDFNFTEVTASYTLQVSVGS